MKASSKNNGGGNQKLQKREKIFSRSRDTHEDRGIRQAKTSRNAQSLPHVSER